MLLHIIYKISSNPSFPSGPEALWAGGQRGEIEERFLQRGAKGSNIYPLNYAETHNKFMTHYTRGFDPPKEM
jgi:hypothetical protein